MSELRRSQITDWCHEIIRTQVKREGVYIDATMGNGHDTLLLCEMAGATGNVYAFDIQKQALEATKGRLEQHGFGNQLVQIGMESEQICESSNFDEKNVHLILDGHEHMEDYAEAESADLICFNFGYLPGGDHAICTKIETDLMALASSLRLLKRGGLLCLCIYSGGDTGFEERDSIFQFLKKLPAKKYTVIMNQYFNRDNNPPIPVFVWKEA